MLKSVVMHDIPIDHVAAMERPNDEFLRDSRGYL